MNIFSFLIYIGQSFVEGHQIGFFSNKRNGLARYLGIILRQKTRNRRPIIHY